MSFSAQGRIANQPKMEMYISGIILTPSGHPPTGKGLGALICVLNMPYELGYQMYLAYELAYVRARFVGDHTFEMDLLSWEQIHEERTRRREAEDGMLGSRETGSREAAKQESRKARQQGRMQRETGKQGSCEAEKLGRMATGKQGISRTPKQRSREARRHGNRKARKQRSEKAGK